MQQPESSLLLQLIDGSRYPEIASALASATHPLLIKTKIAAQILARVQPSFAIASHPFLDCYYKSLVANEHLGIATTETNVLDIEKALAGLKPSSPDWIHLQHLLAQQLYKLNQFDKVAAIYQKITHLDTSLAGHDPNETIHLNPSSAEHDSNETTDQTLVNFAASISQLHHQQSFENNKLSPSKFNTDFKSQSHQLLYNNASIHIATGNFTLAKDLLSRAMKSCRAEMVHEEWDETEIIKEEVTIKMQLAYVLQKTGNVTDAIEMYKSILSSGYTFINIRKSTYLYLTQ